MIVGTVGHIDHGKTTLVRALTGVDTDRLKEEKARGITIELGYAYVAFDGGVLGFVDVPGHERLIHTMVAGACGIEFVLLVIAADDGIMPQTREHLAIVEWLGIERGAVALTKCDRVDAARLRLVHDEVESLISETVLAGAPIFEVCATCDGDGGVAALDNYLRTCALDGGRRSRDGFFRLAVDRVFTLAGAGTIVTGTVFGGCVRVGDTVWLGPGPRAMARVRSLHAYNRAADVAYAGDRCALNLAGVRKDQIARGDWVACKRVAPGSERIDVELTLLSDVRLDARKQACLHVHLGTMHRVARAVPIDEVQGSQRFTRFQLIFDGPVCAIAGDRFIVRDAQAMRTLGGGRVLDPFAPSRKRRSPERRAWLDAIVRWLDAGEMDALVAQAVCGVRRSVVERSLGVGREEMRLPDEVVVVPIRGESGDDEWLIGGQRWERLGLEVVAALRRFHEASPEEPGIEAGRLRRMAAPRVEETLWRARLEALIECADVVRSGAWLHLPGYSVVLGDDERALAERVLTLLREGGVEPSWVRDVARALDVPEETARRLLCKLARRGEVYQVIRDLFYHRDAINEVAHVVEDIGLSKEGRVTAAAFRDATGLGRKRAIQVLEFFDRVGYTRFLRDAHMLRSGAGLEDRF